MSLLSFTVRKGTAKNETIFDFGTAQYSEDETTKYGGKRELKLCKFVLNVDKNYGVWVSDRLVPALTSGVLNFCSLSFLNIIQKMSGGPI